jgi:hypothetical protein
MIETQQPTTVAARLKESDNVLLWVQRNLNGLRIPALPRDKRVQLAAGCLHMAIEHGQAIVVLVHERLYGSALALVRPLFEAFVRGLWLNHAASDAAVDDAGQDQFPSIGVMIAALEAGKLPTQSLSSIKADYWKLLCSFTHTGYRQIDARLGSTGLDSNYKNEEITAALGWADGISLMCMVQFAGLIEDDETAKTIALTALDKMGASE